MINKFSHILKGHAQKFHHSVVSNSRRLEISQNYINTLQTYQNNILIGKVQNTHKT